MQTEVYRNILSGFRKNSLDTIESIRQAVEEKDTDRLVALAHTLKGSSGSIGAIDLACAARDLEAVALKHADRAMLEPPSKRVAEALDIVLTSILNIENSSETEPAEVMPDSTFDESHFNEVLDELAEALRLADPEKINRVLPRLKGVIKGGKISQLERLIEKYDYDEALQILTKLVNDRSFVI